MITTYLPLAVTTKAAEMQVAFTLDSSDESYKQRKLVQTDIFHCRPDFFSKNSEMLSAYVGVLIMMVMALYARYVDICKTYSLKNQCSEKDSDPLRSQIITRSSASNNTQQNVWKYITHFFVSGV